MGMTAGTLIVAGTGGDGDDCIVTDGSECAMDEVEDATEDRGVKESKRGDRL
jgi:hypothetical protein